MTSRPETFRLRNESDIFNVSTAMSQIEINRPQKKYNIRLNNIDNINKFINKPNLSKAEKFQQKIKKNLSDSNFTSTKASTKVYNSNNEKKYYKLNRVNSENNYFPKFKNDLSPFQRKIIEIYGNDENKLKYIKSQNIKSSKGKIERETKNINQHKILSQSLTCNRFNGKYIKQSFDIEVKDNKKFNNNNSSRENKMNSLKSNIFFVPNCEQKNNNINLKINKQSLTDRNQTNISFQKKVNYNKNEEFTKLNNVFDWKDSSNEIWLRRYYKNNILNHRERKLRDLNGSMDDKNLNYKPNNNKNINISDTDIKKNKIKLVKKFYKGKSNSLIQKQISNISILSQDEFYENNLICANKNDKKNKNDYKNEICHSYSIENVKYEDIPEIKKLLTNNGIHIIKTLLNGYTLTGDKKGKMIIKIRENKNDKLYNQHLKNASNEILKNVKGISIINDEQIKKEIKLVPNFPADVNWQYSNTYLYSKNRLDKTNNPQISRKKGKFNRSNQIEYSKMLINKNKNVKK